MEQMTDVILSNKDIERFLSKVDKKDSKDCWPWKGPLRGKGYGYIGINGKKIKANRVAWTIANGPIPKGKLILHKCDNATCCNPAHLYAGTHCENNLDREYRGSGYLKGRPSSLSVYDIETIKELYKIGIYQKEIAKRYGISQTYISFILSEDRGINARG